MTPPFNDYLCLGLLSNGSAYGAVICTCAAIETFVSVDYVLAVSFCDAFNGATFNTSTAADAFVSDLVSHDMYLHVKL